jgi:hypothetical protein
MADTQGGKRGRRGNQTVRLQLTKHKFVIPTPHGPIKRVLRLPPTDALRHADGMPWLWPFAPERWKPSPSNRIRELVKAGALIAAEIDRLQRTKETP